MKCGKKSVSWQLEVGGKEKKSGAKWQKPPRSVQKHHKKPKVTQSTLWDQKLTPFYDTMTELRSRADFNSSFVV